MIHKFGYEPVADDRDKAYDVAAHLEFGIDDIFAHTKEWETGPILDQGDSLACCAFSAAGLVAAAPRRHAAVDPWGIFAAMHKIDGKPLVAASTPRCAMQVLQDRDLIKSYLWCFSATDAWNFVLNHGPIIAGLPWYNSMMIPDKDGKVVVNTETPFLGGHCIMINGVFGDKQWFRFANSGGPYWGINGRAFLSFEDFDKLLKIQHLIATVAAPVDKVVVPK